MSKAQDPFRGAAIYWSMGSLASAAGKHTLEICGDVLIGQELAGAERVASLARGGDGKAAEFRGGCLIARDILPASSAPLKAFTVHLRAQVADIQPAMLFSWGSSESYVRIFTRLAGDDPALHAFDVDQQNYPAYPGDGTPAVLEVDIRLENANPKWRSMRVGVLLAMIGADRWHDITLRFSGPKLDLFVDGVLVDEQWPVGVVPCGSAITLGGNVTEGGVTSALHGIIDSAALWTHALPDREICQLAGGAAEVVQRETEILGPQKTRLQYFTPRGLNQWVGDTMPFYHDGLFHLLYLIDRRHAYSKFSNSGHFIAHATSRDLVTWEHHPLAVDIEDQCETCGTGTMVFWQGKYYLFHGLHTDRIVPREQTMIGKARELLEENGCSVPLPFYDEGKYPMGATFSTSDDGIHFERSRLIIHPSQNPSVFVDETNEQLLMLAGYSDEGLYTSKDALHWQRQEPLIPFSQASPNWNSSECQSLFEWNGWHYIIAGRTGFWMAREKFGPYHTVTAPRARPGQRAGRPTLGSVRWALGADGCALQG